MFILFGVSSLMAQLATSFDNKIVKKTNQKTSVKINDWKRIEIKKFSFLIPENFTLTKKTRYRNIFLAIP
jgi:hypothetical protein